MIQMAGVDHTSASVQEREALSFTSSEKEAAYARLGGLNAVLLTTCHRTELYVLSGSEGQAMLSGSEGQAMLSSHDDQLGAPHPDAANLLRMLKPTTAKLTELSGHDAIEHIFALAAGLKSKIVGDEQIISQLSDALAEAKNAGPVLRHLFQSAVASGKRARTQTGAVRLKSGVATAALDTADKLLGGLFGKRALVIGSGTIGCLVASELQKRGCLTTMTLRNRRKMPQELLKGVELTEYAERYDYMADGRKLDLIACATGSPHFVLTRDRMEASYAPPLLMLDLAMPRDVEPACSSLPGVTLLNVDELCDEVFPEEAMNGMRRCSAQGADRFCEWLAAREALPAYQAVSRYIASSASGAKGLSDAQREDVFKQAEAAVERLFFEAKAYEGAEAFARSAKLLAKAANNERTKERSV